MRYTARLFVALVLAGTAELHAGALAVVGGTIIDGNGGTPVPNGVILVEGNRIVAIGGPSTRVPAHSQVISASGKYIVPGLMDANVHLVQDIWPETLARYSGRYDELAVEAAQITLSQGVTTVFDTWGPREALAKARDAISSDHIVGSRIYFAGNIVGLGGPFSEDFFSQFAAQMPVELANSVNALWQENVGPELLWMSPREVREQIRSYLQRHIDFLKFSVSGHRPGTLQYILFSPRIQRLMVEEAHRANITVQARATSTESLHLAAEAGVDLIQHCDVTFGPSPIDAETIALIADRRIPCGLLPNTQSALAWYREKARSIPQFQRYAVTDRNDRALLEGGVTLLLSTDGGLFSAPTMAREDWKSWNPPEDNLIVLGSGHFHWLKAMEQKGMKPMDALLAATRNVARAYRLDRELGTLEKGKRADLLILDRNPLESAANYRSIHLVMKDGQIIDRDALPTQRLLTHH